MKNAVFEQTIESSDTEHVPSTNRLTEESINIHSQFIRQLGMRSFCFPFRVPSENRRKSLLLKEKISVTGSSEKIRKASAAAPAVLKVR